MSISRTVARPLLASIFLVGPISTLRSSAGAAKKAEPVTDPLIRLAQRAGVPLPQDPEKLVKINAGVQLAAGLCLATGRWPRLAAGVLATSLVPTTLAGHDFWNETDPNVRKQQQLQLAKNLSLLGGLLIAAGDTDGKPGVAWLAKHAVQDARRDLGHAAHTAKLETKVAALGADRGTAAVGATVGTALLAAGKHATEAVKDAAQQAAASDTTQHLTERAGEVAASLKETAQAKAPVVAAAARDHASTLAASAAASAKDARSEAEPMIKEWRKQARKQAKRARKQAEPVIKDFRKEAKKKAKRARKAANKKGPALAAAARDQATAARAQAMVVGELAKAKLA
jgi:uncharacterized membrane protein YphA (DoxX/SURF4 family)